MPNKLNKVLFFMVILVLLASWACKKGEAVQGVKIQNPVFLPKISVGQFDSFLIDQHRLANQPAYAIAVVYKDKNHLPKV
jgi:hypothetical protein